MLDISCKERVSCITSWVPGKGRIPVGAVETIKQLILCFSLTMFCGSDAREDRFDNAIPA